MERWLAVAYKLNGDPAQVTVLGAYGPDDGYYENAEQAKAAAVRLQNAGVCPGADWSTLPVHLITVH